jgi:hypothetical protein
MKKRQKSKVRSRKLNRFSIILVLFGLILGSCNSGKPKAPTAEKSDESGVAKFVFSEEIHNFGSLKAGEVVSYTFVFRNEGTKTLIIENAETDCGCTQIKIPRKEIAPNTEGQIEIIFDSAGEVGRELKTITISSNAEKPRIQIYIKANVTNDIIEINS